MSLRHSLYTLGALVIMSGFSLAYAGFSVYISPAPGTYDHPVSVSIRAERSDAKVFYTFKPNGTPMDTYGYTGAIRIVRSTPIDYFAVVSPTDESKIFSGSYTIAYPIEIGFGSGHLAVTATGSIDIAVTSTRIAGYDIGGWQIVGQDDARTIPDGTYVASGATYTATGFTYRSGVISLRSPDGEEHATLTVDIVPPTSATTQTSPDTATPSRHEYIPRQSTPHEVVPSSRPAIVPDTTPSVASPAVPVLSATGSADTSVVSSPSASVSTWVSTASSGSASTATTTPSANPPAPSNITTPPSTGSLMPTETVPPAMTPAQDTASGVTDPALTTKTSLVESDTILGKYGFFVILGIVMLLGIGIHVWWRGDEHE